ncbi:hypothetical protein O181_036068 [Austropuccinia psidii MF-1]|uniref:Uncharacterized protein n=1 Tax=Austropuccinia psidii MF-1 TaxID=1389203 RepID=A0A9Q3D6P0_9BASI|nr:hypothetical protein [Austropuccinia psidii MF-1]
MEGVEVYTSSPIFHKERVTGNHHLYAFNPKMGHSCTLRVHLVNDEDENMSPTQSETKGKPRREDLMVHEKGTKRNSEFTHPQMALAHSLLEQSEIRQKRNKSCKSLNVEKGSSQKDQHRFLKAEIPDSFHGMRSAVNSHLLFLLKVKDNYFSALPEPQSTEEHEIALKVAGHLGYIPEDVFNEPSAQVQSQGFQSYCENQLHKLGLN